MSHDVHILVVEDSQTQALEIQYFLEKSGYRVSVANDGIKALARLEELTPTIIISDIVMPNMNGYELCEKVRQKDNLRHIPVILLTALSEPEDVIGGLACGANNFIVKPYNEKFLLSQIQYILENQEIRKSTPSQEGTEIYFRGKRYYLTSEGVQVIDLLLSTYEAALQKNIDFKKANDELQQARDELERRVQERTADLQEANELLKKEVEDRKRAEEALRNAAAEWRTTFDTMPDLVMLLDPNQRIIRANKALAKALGLSYQEILGQKYFQCLHGRDAPPDSCVHAQAMADGKEHTDEIYEPRLGVHFFITATPLFDDSGTPTGSVFVMRDITKRKQAEEELLKYQEQLRSLSSQLTLTEEKERRLIATHLHDHVGQMLAIAKMKLSELQNTFSSSDRETSLEEIQGFIEEALQETRSLVTDISPPVLYELGLEAAIKWLAEQVHEKHGIAYNIEDNKQPKPLNDDTRSILFQAARELLFNTVKHADASQICLLIKRDGEYMHIEIKDDGVGFDYESKRHYEGVSNGFGLFNIRERLNHIGGRLEIESEAGQGTRCTLIAPLRLDEETKEGNKNEHKDYSS